MSKLTWSEYYSNFYDWSPSTQKSYSYLLEDYGSAEELIEIATEFAFDDEKFASKFIDKALEAGVIFTPEHVLEMTLNIEKPVLSRMAENTSVDFSLEELEEIYMLIDDESFNRICAKQGVDIFAADTGEETYIEEILDYEEAEEIRKRKNLLPGCLRYCLLLPDPLTKSINIATTDDVMETAQIARRIMGTDMVDGTMDMVIRGAVCLAATRVMAVCRIDLVHIAYKVKYVLIKPEE